MIGFLISLTPLSVNNVACAQIDEGFSDIGLGQAADHFHFTVGQILDHGQTIDLVLDQFSGGDPQTFLRWVTTILGIRVMMTPTGS